MRLFAYVWYISGVESFQKRLKSYKEQARPLSTQLKEEPGKWGFAWDMVID